MIRLRGCLRRALRTGQAALAALSVLVAWTHWGGGADAPRIGLSVSDDWYDRSELNPAATGLALARAGARVRDLHPGDLRDLDRILDGLDGVVLVGGMDDVDPALYGGDPRSARAVEPERDAFELALVRKAEARGLPVLGLCRGAQMLSVAYGGTLRRLQGAGAARHGVSLGSLSAHEVSIVPGSRLEGLVGGGSFRVSSTHVQSIADPGSRLRVAARSDDGIIEAVELPGPRLVLGLQWHPEWEPLGGDRSLAPFRSLVQAARLRPRPLSSGSLRLNP